MERDALAHSALLCDAGTVDSELQILRKTLSYVFLDRDGVINRKLPEGHYVTNPEALTLAPGAAAAIARLNRSGLKVLVVTNQRGISLGLYTEADLQAIHHKLSALLLVEDAHLDGIYYCPHAKNSCDCRKPGLGLFSKAFRDFPEANPINSVMVGDSLSDIQAGHHLGMATVFIEGDVSTRPRGSVEAAKLSDYRAASLAGFVDRLLV
jgi:D-glycero-D-manno-heptose 1,7-bisphosphate phosphatase